MQFDILIPNHITKIGGKDEDTNEKKTVAIVDPPRAGLHPKAVFALRASSVNSLVYVSCDARAAMNNFVDLGRMTSKAYKGDPFIPKRVIPVDLFPHTNHFELIIYFERFPLPKKPKEEEKENKEEEENVKIKEEKMEIKKEVEKIKEENEIKEEKMEI